MNNEVLAPIEAKFKKRAVRQRSSGTILGLQGPPTARYDTW